jgi:hypothetical protein
MVSSVRKCIASLLLLVMVANLCVWDSSRSRIAHQLRHVATLDGNALTHGHPAATGGTLAKGELTHMLLHAVDHLQFFAGSAPADCCLVAATQTLFTVHSDIAPPRGASDPPFRPPSFVHAA